MQRSHTSKYAMKILLKEDSVPWVTCCVHTHKKECSEWSLSLQKHFLKLVFNWTNTQRKSLYFSISLHSDGKKKKSLHTSCDC